MKPSFGDDFTKREEGLLLSIKAEGYYPKLISDMECITLNTFYTHMKNIRTKTGTHNGADIMKYIYEHPEIGKKRK